MLAIVILGVVVVYFAAAIASVRLLTGAMEKRGDSRRKRLAAGCVVGLAFFMAPFWDWIPSVVAHRFYCATEARFTVHKPIEQWMKENKDILSELQHDPNAVSVQVEAYLRYPINRRLVAEVGNRNRVFLAVKREDGRIKDVKTNEILVDFVEFFSGYGSFSVGGEDAWKFWLDTGACKGRLGNSELFAQTLDSAIGKFKKDTR